MDATVLPTQTLTAQLAASPDAAAARAIVWAAIDSGAWWAQDNLQLRAAIAAIPAFDEALVLTLAVADEFVADLQAVPAVTRAQRTWLDRVARSRAAVEHDGIVPSWPMAFLEDAIRRAPTTAGADAAGAEDDEAQVFAVLWRLSRPPRVGDPLTSLHRHCMLALVTAASHHLTEAHLLDLLAANVCSGRGVVSRLTHHPLAGAAFMDRALAVLEGRWPCADGHPLPVSSHVRVWLAIDLADRADLHASPAWRARWWRALAPRGRSDGPEAWYHPDAVKSDSTRDPLLAIAARSDAPDRHLAFRAWVMSVGSDGSWPRFLDRFTQAIDRQLATTMLHSTYAEVRQIGLMALAGAPVPPARWDEAPPPSEDAVWPVLLPVVRDRLAHHQEDLAGWDRTLREGSPSLLALPAALRHEVSAAGMQTVRDAISEATRFARALQMARAHLATIVPEAGALERPTGAFPRAPSRTGPR